MTDHLQRNGPMPTQSGPRKLLRYFRTRRSQSKVDNIGFLEVLEWIIPNWSNTIIIETHSKLSPRKHKERLRPSVRTHLTMEAYQ